MRNRGYPDLIDGHPVYFTSMSAYRWGRKSAGNSTLPTQIIWLTSCLKCRAKV